LAFVSADARADALGRLVADDVEHAIVAPAESVNWRFDLLGDDGRRTGGFRPFRLRRGGRLHTGELSVVLQGHSWSNDRWSFATADGHRVEATVVSSGERRRGGGGGAAGGGEVEIALETAAPTGAVPPSAHALVLAFGCWLIAQWHAVSPGDHMLTSTGAGGELASALGSPRSGGIARREANWEKFPDGSNRGG
jgi:hypothetical protein